MKSPKVVFLVVAILLHQAFITEQESPDEECNYWYHLCQTLKQSDKTNYKRCINDQTIYYYSPVKARWSMSRFYCQSIFNGYKNADLLYINDISEWSGFVEFMKGINTKPDEVATSALCCARKVVHNQPTKQCLWTVNSKEIGNADLTAFVSGTDCTFLTLNVKDLKPNDKLPFSKKDIDVAANTELPFVCSYSRPTTNCPKPTLKPTTTTEPTQPHRVTESKVQPPITLPTTTTKTTKPTTSVTPPTLPPDVLQCKAKKGEYGIENWPPVLPLAISQVKCPKQTEGIAEWKCGENGKFIGRPNVTCTHLWIDPMIIKVKKVNDVNSLNELARNISEDVGKHEREIKFPGDLSKMVEVVQEIQHRTEHFVAQSQGKDHASVKQITRSVVRTCSKILSHDDAWKNGGTNETVHIAENVLRYIQYAGVTFGCSEANSNLDAKLDIGLNNHDKERSNIFMSAFNMDHQQPISFFYNGLNFSLTNYIDDNKPVSKETCNHKIGVGAVFDKLSKYLSLNMTNDNMLINSEIVAFNYNNKTSTFYLPNSTYAKMILTHHSRLEFGSKPYCVFWDFNSNSWSSEGCWIEQSLSSVEESVCMCNHLTSFSVLMDVSGREEPSQVKNILTIVCTSASVVCLIITIVLFALCRELQNRRTTILINLSISLIIVDLLVLFGLDQINHPVICKSVSVLLLYWLLTSFSWMLMEGYQLYQMVILVFNNIGHLRMLYMYLIGYGVPMVMTAIAAVVIHFNNGLTNDYFCWITSKRHPYQILALVVPATLVIIINTVIMYLVLKTVFQMKFGKRALRPASSSSPSKTTSTAVSSSPTGANATTNTNRQRNITLAVNGTDRGTDSGSSSASSANSKKRLFEKNTNSSVSITDTGTSKNSSDDVPLEKQISQWMSYIKGYVSLIVLMGITWITYVLYIHEYGHFFSYVFIVLNGLQGVFIFITQFVFDSKTYGAVKKRFFHFMGQDYFRSMTNSSSTKNTVSSSYSTSTRTNANNSTAVSQTDYSAYQNSNTLNRSDKDLSSLSSSSGTSSLNQSSEMAAIFKEHSAKQRKYSLEYF